MSRCSLIAIWIVLNIDDIWIFRTTCKMQISMYQLCVFLDYKLIEITYIFFLYDNMNLKIWNTRTQTADKILKRFMTSYTYAYFMHKSGFLTKILWCYWIFHSLSIYDCTSLIFKLKMHWFPSIISSVRSVSDLQFNYIWILILIILKKSIGFS